ncbi:hypothetical protein L195_g045655 [Trifolium pratense]|uniref:Uncharacterized protein n=1 Tax=Trifolium pratense TaxID=57577 RepID=A0A2K3MFG0_TRIPR|nr:hypothetical protein L195_g045655 [Trifolium pratense]
MGRLPGWQNRSLTSCSIKRAAVGQVKHSIFVRLKLKGIRERKFLFPGISMGIRAGALSPISDWRMVLDPSDSLSTTQKERLKQKNGLR